MPSNQTNSEQVLPVLGQSGPESNDNEGVIHIIQTRLLHEERAYSSVDGIFSKI